MATKKSPTSTSTGSSSPTAQKKAPAKKASTTTIAARAPPVAARAPALTTAAATRAPSGRTTSGAVAKPALSTTALAERLRRCPEAREVKVPEERGIAVRLKTKHLEIPMLVHLPHETDGLVVFDVYPFRFVGIDAKNTDWLSLIRLAGSSYVQLRLDQDFDDKDVLVYSFHMPLNSLTDDVTTQTVNTLTSFAEDHYDDVMAATGLAEKGTVKR